jgi:hypothetical protein
MQNNLDKPTSFFEFWPSKLMYAPVAIQWLVLSIRHASLTLPLLANPRLNLAGMVGVTKSELMEQAQGLCHDSILAWKKFMTTDLPADTQAKQWSTEVEKIGIHYPFVCKPDIGCRGSGVKLVQNEVELASVIKSYPINTSLLIQKLASYESEAGIFFVKLPHQDQGQVVSLTFKHSPSVIGDGQHTLKELLQKDFRAKDLLHLYQNRHQDNWNKILKNGEKLNLIFSASHCQGAVFEDARQHVTSELTNYINTLMSGLPDFYYGRLDVKFSTLEKLKKGKTIEIIEINGASAESIHIWDKKTKFLDAIKTLLWQYRTLFKLGAYHRSHGYKTPGIKKLYKHWRIEKQLAKYYPDTD